VDTHKPALAFREHVFLQSFSTLGIGGPARWFARADTIADVQTIHTWCVEHELPLFVLGGGSNLVISDEGFSGVVMHMAVAGLTMRALASGDGHGETLVKAGAGESWDRVVESVVARDLSGVECLSGIPGTVGGTPIQNVGAYGQEVASVIDHVVAFDRSQSSLVELTSDDCGFSYRMSRFKGEDAGRFIVCAVSLRLTRSTPVVTYPELRTEIERRGHARPRPSEVRDAVLTIRRRKGMVIDASDPDTRSVGSFFMNPVVSLDDRERIATLAGEGVPGFAMPERRVKIPAAWLIERSGIRKGHSKGSVGVSTKHPLAIVNRGGATTRDVLRFAVQVKRAVVDWCDVWLRPEPVFVGLDGDEDVGFLQKAH
jgi:UDP-N-acetylmuramate dehydrogenase